MEEEGGDQGGKREEGQGKGEKEEKLKRGMYAASCKNQGLKRETSEEGQTHIPAQPCPALPSPGEAELTARFSQRRRPSTAHLGVLPGQGLSGRRQGR